MNDVKKVCPACGKLKSLLRFGSRKAIAEGREKATCRECRGGKRRLRNREAQERRRLARRAAEAGAS